MSTTNATRSTRILPEATRVIELGEAFSTALTGRLLERMGARVTRVSLAGEASELDALGPLLGDEQNGPSAVAVWLREGKESFQLDLKEPAERQHLNNLLSDASVVLITGTTDSWAERGIHIDDIRRHAVNAVIGHVAPWGNSGPRAHFRSNELLLQADGGFMNLVGLADREPVRLGGHPLQSIAGLLVLDGVMIGLFHRQSTGQPTFFETSEFEAVAHAEWKIASMYQTGEPIDKRGEDGGGPMATRTRDGHFGLFFTPREWGVMKEILGDARLDDPKFDTPRSRAEHESELKELFEQTTQSMSKRDLYERAQARGIPAGYVATMSDLLKSPQYEARDFFRDVEVEGIGIGKIPDAPWAIRTIDDLPEDDAA